MNFNQMPLTAGLQPQVGLQSGLMGYAPPNMQIPQMSQGLPASTMGPWSQLAYQMAGSPHQGGLLAAVPPPTAIPGSLPGSSSSGSSGGIGTGILTGLLGSIAKNPGLVKSAYNGISGLLGGGPGTTASAPAAAGTAGQTFAPTGSSVTDGAGGTSTLFGDAGGASAAGPAGTTTFFGGADAGAGGLLGADGALTGASVAPVGVDAVSELPSAVGAVNAGASTGGGLLGSGVSGTQALGAVAVPLSLYSEVGNWQSGATGSDALGGAESGAALGTAIMPGIGTAIGAVGGALAGALSSAFGAGKVDPENANFNQYTTAFNNTPAAQQAQVAAGVQNPYLPLAGYFDLRSGQMKGSNPIYTTYGRMGEQSFTNDLISKVQGAQKAGVTDPTQVYSSVVQPWLNSMGNWQDSNKNAMTGLIQNMTGQILAGTYKQNFKATGGQQVWS
jgi:hypothetical protein